MRQSGEAELGNMSGIPIHRVGTFDYVRTWPIDDSAGVAVHQNCPMLLSRQRSTCNPSGPQG